MPIFEISLRDTRVYSLPVEAENLEAALAKAEEEFCKLSHAQIEPLCSHAEECELICAHLDGDSVWSAY